MGVGIPAAAAAGWVAKTLTVARGVPEVANVIAQGLSQNTLASLGEFGLNNIEHLSGSTGTHNDGSDLSRNPWDSVPEDASEFPDGTEHDGYTPDSQDFEDRPDDITENADDRIENWLDDVQDDQFGPRQFEDALDQGSEWGNFEDLGTDAADSIGELGSLEDLGSDVAVVIDELGNIQGLGSNVANSINGLGNDLGSEVANSINEFGNAADELGNVVDDLGSNVADSVNIQGTVEDLGSAVTDSVNELENMIREAGYESEEAVQVMSELQADLAASSESIVSGTQGAASSLFGWLTNTVSNVFRGATHAAGGAASAAGGAANAAAGAAAGGAASAASGASSAITSFGAQVAADLASSGAGAEEVAGALIQAGVPTGSVASTSQAITNALKSLPQAGSSNAARNAALNIISKAITPRGAAISEAASAALGGAPGEAVASALRGAGVAEDAIDSTAQGVNDAINAARAAGETGSKLSATAIDAISHAFPPDSFETRSGSLRAPSKAAIRQISRGLLNVIGASFNFWHVYPHAVYGALKKYEGDKHSKISKTVAKILENGPPPQPRPLKDMTFPFRHRRMRADIVKVLPGPDGKAPGTRPSRPKPKGPLPTGEGYEKTPSKIPSWPTPKGPLPTGKGYEKTPSTIPSWPTPEGPLPTPEKAPSTIPDKEPSKGPEKTPSTIPDKEASRGPGKTPSMSPDKETSEIPDRIPSKSPEKAPNTSPSQPTPKGPLPTGKSPDKTPSISPSQPLPKGPLPTPEKIPSTIPSQPTPKAPSMGPSRPTPKGPLPTPDKIPGTIPSQPTPKGASPAEKSPDKAPSTTSQPTPKGPSPTGKVPDKVTDTSSAAKPAYTPTGYCATFTDEQMDETFRNDGKMLSDGLTRFLDDIKRPDYLTYLAQNKAELDRMLDAVPIVICQLNSDPRAVETTPIHTDPDVVRKALFSLWNRLLEIGSTGKISNPSAALVSTEPTVPKSGPCSVMTQEDMVLAHNFDMDPYLYKYGGVNKTALANNAKLFPKEFAGRGTWDDHLVMCAMQIEVDSPTVSGLEKTRSQFVLSLWEELMSAEAEIPTAGIDSDGSLPLAHFTEGGVLRQKSDAAIPLVPGRKDAPAVEDVFIEVPKLWLPLGSLCPLIEDIDAYVRLLREEAKENSVESLHAFYQPFWDTLDLFENHREPYLLHMRLHPDKLFTAVEALEDTECSILTAYKKFPKATVDPLGQPTGHEVMARMQPVLKALREIQQE